MGYLFKTFRSPAGYYLYDGNNLYLLNIPKQEWEALRRIETGEAGPDDQKVLAKYQSSGMCRHSKVNSLTHPATKYINYFLNNRLEHMVLQVTQNCNLRCEYCTFSGHYNNRSHSHKRMTFETAQRSVDYLMTHSKNTSTLSIGFYGGEPLLEFPLIKRVTDYINENYGARHVHYAMTTNGTLFSDDIIDFLQKLGFSVMVSIDGPEEYHDMHRKFANGQGSFQTVMANLEKIREKYPDYYLSNIAINNVITPEHDLTCLTEFYQADDIIKKLHLTSAYVNELYTDEKPQYGAAFEAVHAYEYFIFLLWMVGAIDASAVARTYYDKFDKIHRRYQDMQKHAELPEECHPGGPCIAGSKKLFINADGTFYPCERISESSQIMQIGSLDAGINQEKVNDLLNVGRCTVDACKQCWCFTFCIQCAAYADDLGPVCSSEKRLAACEGSQRMNMELLQDICFLSERGYDFVLRRPQV